MDKQVFPTKSEQLRLIEESTQRIKDAKESIRHVNQKYQQVVPPPNGERVLSRLPET